jgi:hypothetical protein
MKNKFNLFVFACSAFLLLSMQSCAKTDADQQNTPTTKHAALLDRAKKITLEHKLTPLPLTCLQFVVADEKYDGKPTIVVREKHGGQCGGDPNTSPRLYSLAIDEKSGEVWSDAKSLLGQMEKIGKQ